MTEPTPVRRRRLAAVGVLLLVVTTGCAGLFPGGPAPDDRTTYDVPETTVPPTERPSGPRADEEFRLAVGNHSRALRAAGRFVAVTVTYEYRGESGVDRPPDSRTVAADLRADRYWSGATVSPGDGVYARGKLYQNRSGVYRRVEAADGSARYRLSDATTPTPRQLALRVVRHLPELAARYPLERNGTGVLDGEELARYTASTLPPGAGCSRDGGDPETLRTVLQESVLVLVDDRGIVRKFECVYRGISSTGNRYTERVIRTVTEVGTATVRPPGNQFVENGDP